MRVMVTENVETDLNITNGACGEIVKIVLHKDEPPIAQGAVVKLRYLPAYILIKLSQTKASKLTGLDDCVIPVEPSVRGLPVPDPHQKTTPLYIIPQRHTNTLSGDH